MNKNLVFAAQGDPKMVVVSGHDGISSPSNFDPGISQ